MEIDRNLVSMCRLIRCNMLISGAPSGVAGVECDGGATAAAFFCLPAPCCAIDNSRILHTRRINNALQTIKSNSFAYQL